MLRRSMSSAAKQTFLSARLPGFTGRGDKYLGDIAQDLRRSETFMSTGKPSAEAKTQRTTRRRFLKQTAGLAASAAVVEQFTGGSHA
ncbi:MAG TPA: twin-arginine translocation signal domain-containing protein, partial [Verrucomicrobiae bacterium]|nr:twin-arginine translocation signal domain-containing protein [Verrucomicrobiae bacterium]